MATLDKRELLHTISLDTCLHCRVTALVVLHYAQYGDQQGTVRLISIQEALQALAQVAGELIAINPDKAAREKFTVNVDRDVRASISEALKHAGEHHHDIAWPQ